MGAPPKNLGLARCANIVSCKKMLLPLKNLYLRCVTLSRSSSYEEDVAKLNQ